jgi:peptidoglycan/LPS O-acetylase OafA/YrhL
MASISNTLVLNVLVEMGYLGNWFYMLPVVGMTFLAGALSWRYVERPFLRRKRQTIHVVANGSF